MQIYSFSVNYANFQDFFFHFRFKKRNYSVKIEDKNRNYSVKTRGKNRNYSEKSSCMNLFISTYIHLYEIFYLTEVSHMGKLREVREVRGKLRDKCPKFKLEDYCLLTSRTTVGSDNFFNFN